MKKPTETTATPRDNNPFFIAFDGLTILFNRSIQVALTLAVISGVLFFVQDRASINVPESIETNQQLVDYFNEERAAFIDKIQSIDSGDWAVIGVIGTLLLLGVIVTSTLISGIGSFTAAKMMEGETVTLSEALDAVFDRFFSYLWLQILVILKIIAWSLLLIIPGVIMAIRYSLAGVAFFDKNLSPKEAVKRSSVVVKGSWVTTYASQTLFNVITFTLLQPLVKPSTNGVLYSRLGHYHDTKKSRPKPHSLSWAVFLLPLFGLASLILLGIAVVVVT